MPRSRSFTPRTSSSRTAIRPDPTEIARAGTFPQRTARPLSFRSRTKTHCHRRRLHAPLLLAFAAAATLFAVTPGIDTALVLRTAAINARSALFAALGICLGCLCWGVAASLGLGAVLRASALAYAAVKWAGAAYLVWVGARLLLKPRQALGTHTVSVQPNAAASLRRGFLTNILNPKVGVFYITFLPQFVPHGAPVATTSILLAAIHVAISFAWFCALVAAIAPLGRFLRKPSVVRTLNRLTGGVFIAFGVKLAVARG